MQVARTTRGQLSEFLELVPYPSGDADLLAETESLRQSFNRRIAQSDGDFDEIRAAIDAVRTWSSGKTGDLRREYGRTAWYLTHRSQSPKSSGSFAIHAFPDVIAEEVQRSTSYRAPVLADTTLVTSRSKDVETVESRICRRAVEAPRIDVDVHAVPVIALRLIGGHRILQELYGVAEKEALAHLAQCLSGTGPDAHGWMAMTGEVVTAFGLQHLIKTKTPQIVDRSVPGECS